MMTSKHFSKQYPVIIFFVVTIPLVLIANTYIQLKNTADLVNMQSENMANSIANVFTATVNANFNQPDLIKAETVAAISADTAIQEITVYQFKNNALNAITSTNQQKETEILTQPNQSVSWQTGQVKATLNTTATDEKVWTVDVPIKDQDHQKIGLVTMDVSTTDTDNLVERNIQFAWFVLIASVIILMPVLIYRAYT